MSKGIPFILVIFFIIMIIGIKKKNYILILYILIFCISSVCLCNKIVDYNKYEQYNNKQIKIEGIIVSDADEKEYKDVYVVKVTSLNDKQIDAIQLLLYIKRNNKYDKLEYGNKVEIIGMFEKGNIARNYKGFNYKEYLKTQGIYGIITSENTNIKIIKIKGLSKFNMLIHKLVNKLKENLKKLLPEKVANLEMGILLGYSKDIDEGTIQAFTDSNLTHLLAVSGQNTVYVILIINLIFRKKIVGNRGQKIITIIIILFFIKITGETLSVIRAGITCIIYMFASLFYRKVDTINTIAIATIVTILINPFNIFNIGMQLSYAGTISIIIFYNILEKFINVKSQILKYLLETIMLTLSANIFIIPIMIYHFNIISLTFIFSNLCVGPLIGLATIMGIIILIISIVNLKLAIILSPVLNAILNLIIKIAEFFANISISKIYVITPKLYIVFSFYIIMSILIYETKRGKIKEALKKYLKKFLIAISIIIIISSIFTWIQFKDKLIIHFVDQTTLNMIQDISSIIARKPMIIGEI